MLSFNCSVTCDTARAKESFVRCDTSSPIKMRMRSTFCHSSFRPSNEPISKYPVAMSIALESWHQSCR